MHRDGAPGFRSPAPLRLALLAIGLLGAARAGAQVTLSVTSATVSQPGEMTQVCVLLDSGGQVVAGTQNELVWDGTCATIEDPRFACQASPGHGKQLSAAFPPGRDFTLRAFVLSLSDTNPINQRELYCCSVRSELTEPGTSCPVNVTNVGASSPEGRALSTRSGGAGEIRYAGSAREPEPLRRAPVGAVLPPSAVGGNVGAGQPTGQGGAEPAPAAGGGSGGGASAPAIVVAGGGERAPEEAAPAREEEAPPGAAVQAVVPVEAAPTAGAPGGGATVQGGVALGGLPAGAPLPAGEAPPAAVGGTGPEAEEAAVPTAEAPPTPAPTMPALTAVPTVAPTKPAPPATRPLPQAEVEEGVSGLWWAVLLLVLAAAGAVFLWQRRSRGEPKRRS